MTTDRFPSAAHHRATVHLETSAGALLLETVGGHSMLLTSLLAFEAGTIRGVEEDGTLVTVFADVLTSYGLVPQSALETRLATEQRIESLMRPDLEVPADVDEAYVNAWNAALLALRAACDKSPDPDVKAAAEALAAVENATPAAT